MLMRDRLSFVLPSLALLFWVISAGAQFVVNEGCRRRIERLEARMDAVAPVRS